MTYLQPIIILVFVVCIITVMIYTRQFIIKKNHEQILVSETASDLFILTKFLHNNMRMIKHTNPLYAYKLCHFIRPSQIRRTHTLIQYQNNINIFYVMNTFQIKKSFNSLELFSIDTQSKINRIQYKKGQSILQILCFIITFNVHLHQITCNTANNVCIKLFTLLLFVRYQRDQINSEMFVLKFLTFSFPSYTSDVILC